MTDDSAPNQPATMDDVLDRFERDWQSGRQPDISDFIRDAGAGETTDLLPELVRIDLEFRWRTHTQRHASADGLPRNGPVSSRVQGPLLESYFEQFPDLGSLEDCPTDLILHEYRVRHWWGDRPQQGEFLARFAPRGEELSRKLATLDAELQETASVRQFGEFPHGTQPPANADTTVRRTPVTAGNEPPAEFGDYEILGKIARGGMGIVYKARQRSLNRIVALKMIGWGTQASEEEIRRFLAEAESAARLNHPNIVPIHEVGEVAGRHYFSMAFVEGESLAARLADGPLPPRDAAELLRVLALAIQYAHENGIIHRDLKPANVLLQRAESRESRAESQKTREPLPSPATLNPQLSTLNPCITDFGLAKQIEGGLGLTVSGQIMGTPGYMPPEQATGNAAVIGPRSDIYSLGAMLYCVLVGRPPFQAANAIETVQQVIHEAPASPRQLNPAIPRDLETIALKCLEKNPDRRYAAAADLAEDLQRFLDQRPIKARPLSPAGRFFRWYARNRILATSIVFVFASLVAGLGGTLMGFREAERKRRDADEQKDKALIAESTAKSATREKDRQLKRANAAEQDARKRRTQAEQAQKLARQRYEDVRTIGVNQIFEIYDEAVSMPNGTSLRKRLVERGLRLLKGLAADETADVRIRYDVGRAYIRLAEVQGAPGVVNLGSTRGAAESYQQAARVLQEADPKFENLEVQRQRFLAHLGYGKLLSSVGKRDDALIQFANAETVAGRMSRLENGQPQTDRQLGRLAYQRGVTYRGRQTRDKSRQHMEQARDRFRAVIKADPGDWDSRTELARCHDNLAELFFLKRKFAEAKTEFETALKIREEVAKKQPGQLLLHAEMAFNRLALGGALEALGKKAESLRAYDAAITQWIPATGMTIYDAPRVYSIGTRFQSLAYAMARRNVEVELATRMLERAVELFTAVTRFHPDSRVYRMATGMTLSNVGALYLRANRQEKIFEHHERLIRVWESIPNIHPDEDDFLLYRLWITSGRFLMLHGMYPRNSIGVRTRFVSLAHRFFTKATSIGIAMKRRGKDPQTYRSRMRTQPKNVTPVRQAETYRDESGKILKKLERPELPTTEDFRAFLTEKEFRELKAFERKKER